MKDNNNESVKQETEKIDAVVYTRLGIPLNENPLVILTDWKFCRYLKYRSAYMMDDDNQFIKLAQLETEIEINLLKANDPNALNNQIYVDVSQLFRMRTAEFKEIITTNDIVDTYLNDRVITGKDRKKIIDGLLNNLRKEAPRVSFRHISSEKSKEDEFNTNYCNEASLANELKSFRRGLIPYNYKTKEEKLEVLKKIKENVNLIFRDKKLFESDEKFTCKDEFIQIVSFFGEMRENRLEKLNNLDTVKDNPNQVKRNEQYFVIKNDILIDLTPEGTNQVSLTIPKGVQEIGNSAFHNCKYLQNVSLPSSVTKISNYAFSECSSLTKINIPDNVNNIGTEAFKNCQYLNDIKLPQNLKRLSPAVFFGCKSLTKIFVPKGVRVIYAECFAGCSGLKSVSFEQDSELKYIADNAFRDCETLERLDLPSSLAGICQGAFNSCVALKNLTIPASVKWIGDPYFRGEYEDIHGAFEYCTGLESINFEKNSQLKELTDKTFSGCAALKFVNFNENGQLENIQCGVFEDCDSLEYIKIPNTVKSINFYAFCRCDILKTIEFEPESKVEYIGSSAFWECKALQEITIPDSVKTIGENAFAYCDFLQSVIFSENSQLEIIDKGAFYMCTDLKAITIPLSVKLIETEAFNGCTALEKVDLPDHVQVQQDAFKDCPSLENTNQKNEVSPSDETDQDDGMESE